MAIVEIQIRTDRFCELVKSEINSRVLPSPTLDQPDDLKGKLLEKIECVSCSLDEPSDGSNVVTVGANLAFKYHISLANVRAAGSLQPPVTAEKTLPFKLKFTIVFDPSLRSPPFCRTTYSCTDSLSGGRGNFR
jgi:hypothetical protein